MTPIISQGMWVSLPNEVRYRIRSIFNIPCSASTVVSDGRIESDGTTFEDFKALTIEKMQTFLGSQQTDFHKLFDEVVARVNDELVNPKKEVAKNVEVLNANPIVNVKKTKKAKK